MAIRNLTDHEYKINGGSWIGCTTDNCIDNEDGTYTIIEGLDVAIPINGLQVRVKAIGINPPSAVLTNGVAFNVAEEKTIQLFFIGDSLPAGVGTTGTGSSASGNYLGANAYSIQALAMLTDVEITPAFRLFPGATAEYFLDNDMARTITMIDNHNHTDVYAVIHFGANDLIMQTAADLQARITSICEELKDAGVKSIVVPVLSRKDSYAAGVSYANIAKRNTFNSWLASNWEDFADAVVDLSGYPEIFADDAPDDATYFTVGDADGLSKVHLTDLGAELLATAISEAVTDLAETTSLPITPIDHAGLYITAEGITDPTEVSAIEEFVSSLKNGGLWNRFPAIYLWLGSGTRNLKDARDLDEAFRIEFGGTPIIDAGGITWASGSYADTKWSIKALSSYNFQNASLHYYSRAVTSSGIDMGYYDSASFWLGIKFGGNSYSAVNDAIGTGVSESYSDLGMFTTTRNSYNSRSLYRNGVKVRDSTQNVAGPNEHNVWIGALNNAESPQYPSNRTCGYAAIGYGLTEEEEALHYSIVQAFQTALGREV